MKDKEKQIEEIFDILNKLEFFQGQRAGRELWNDKPKEVQDKDIADFIKDINYIRSYLQDSVVLSGEEYEKLKNNLDKGNYGEFENGFSQGYEKGSKETAEKIYTKIKDSFLMNSNNRYALKLWIEEQFGLEIKE